jgi:hypothetical protein
MNPLTLGLAAVAAISVAACAALAGKLSAAKAALAEAQNRKAPPPPPRSVESRREHFGLLWFPTLTVKDDDKVIVSAAAGVPHCARCVRPLALTQGPPEEWACGGCSERRPGTAADLQVTDAVVSETLKEFAARNPGYRTGPGVATRRAAPSAG